MLVELGGGRKYKEQEINYDVGFSIHKKINDNKEFENFVLIKQQLDSQKYGQKITHRNCFRWV